MDDTNPQTQDPQDPAAKTPPTDQPEGDLQVKPAESETPTETPAPETPAPAPAPETPQEPPLQPSVETEAPTETPEVAPEQEAPAETPPEDCGCPTVNSAEWDKQKKQLNKSFYRTFSLRFLHIPLMIGADIKRAINGAEKAGYNVPEKPMILDTGGMFLADVMVEVENPNPEDKNLVSFAGTEVYTKVSTRPWKEIGTDIKELEEELGQKPAQLYMWYTACPKCVAGKDVKTVLVAVPGVAVPAAKPAEAAPGQPGQPEAPTE